MANSANPEINKKIATSALGTLVIATVFFYLGDRYAETLVTYPGQIFDHLSDAFLSMWQTIKDAPFALDMTSNSLLFGGACFLIIWMIWLRYVAFIGNYRSGEESGSARWGTLKEGKKFKDLQTEDNNLLFTKNFGLALHRPKFDPEYDRNLNVLVVGGSGSGKTFNYVTPNICQLNTSYFVTDPKGTLLKDAGYLFTDNGYKLKSFNTINLDESMHYNPLKYVKTDTDILSFVNCFIMNTNPEGKSSGDPFWENAEKMLYTALMLYTQKHLFQALTPKSDYNPHRHGFSIEQVKRFPELLASPVVLANSPTRDDVLLAILLATDAYDTPLIAGIKPDGTGNYGEREVETNMILSVYSRQNFIRYFALLRDMDAFVFVSGRKIEALEDLSGLPLAENCSGLDIDRILQRPKCLG